MATSETKQNNGGKITRPVIKRAYYLVYESLIRGIEKTRGDIPETSDEREWVKGSREDDPSLKLTEKVWDNFEELSEMVDSLLANNTANWKADRLAKTDFALILIGIQILKDGSLSEKELVKDLSELAWQSGATDNSPKFISGIIGAAAKVTS